MNQFSEIRAIVLTSKNCGKATVYRMILKMKKTATKKGVSPLMFLVPVLHTFVLMEKLGNPFFVAEVSLFLHFVCDSLIMVLWESHKF